jgi:membrane complex biogenesis BtpA family protein
MNTNKKSKIIGVLHLQEFPKNKNSKIINEIKQKALADLSSLQFGGVDGVIIENEFEGSKSPYGEFLTKHQKKIMFEVVSFLKPYIFVPLGFCVLLNDYKTALLLAKKFGGKFIRLDTFVDNVERISDGIKIFPDVSAIVKFKNEINAQKVEIWADIHVKHTKLIDKKTIEQSAKQAVLAGADKLIITGTWTGKPPKIKDILKVKKVVPKTSVVIGSGINSKNIYKYKNLVNEFIVGSVFKKNGKVDILSVKKIVSAKDKLCGKIG